MLMAYLNCQASSDTGAPLHVNGNASGGADSIGGARDMGDGGDDEDF